MLVIAIFVLLVVCMAGWILNSVFKGVGMMARDIHHGLKRSVDKAAHSSNTYYCKRCGNPTSRRANLCRDCALLKSII